MKDALGRGNVKSRETDASHYIRGHKRRITLAHIIRGLQPSWIPQYGDFFIFLDCYRFQYMNCAN